MFRQISHWLIAALVVGLSIGVCPVWGHAQSIEYTALKYQTQQTSMASGYFVHPATVTVVAHQYQVTMTLKTAKKLSPWPVKVLAIDGQVPTHLSQTTDRRGNYYLKFSFKTTNLKRLINGKLAINVPHVYKATHMISFRFQMANLPNLGTAKKPRQPGQKPATKTVADQSSTPMKRHSSSVKPSQRPAATVSSVTQSDDRHLTSPAAAASTTEPQHQINWGLISGGVVAIVMLVGGGSYWFFKRH